MFMNIFLKNLYQNPLEKSVKKNNAVLKLTVYFKTQ